jgi:hypothetical protein
MLIWFGHVRLVIKKMWQVLYCFYCYLFTPSEAFIAVAILQNKKERKKVREVGILKKDPEAIREQIENLEKMSKYKYIT